MNTQSEEVKYTGNIPICPNCKVGTIREPLGSVKTTRYFPPIYNEKGENTNVDRNDTTSTYFCKECNKKFSIKGNRHDGYKYI